MSRFIMSLIFVFLFFLASARAQQSEAIDSPLEANTLQTVLSLQEQVEELSVRILAFEGDAQRWITVASVVALFFGIVPFAVGVFFTWTASARASQSHEVWLSGEKATQGRAAEIHETFLAGSQQTLTLVNETLSLAKEASERAARVIEERAIHTLDDLDRNSKNLIAVSATGDDRAIIADPEKRSSLTSLAEKINGFEIQRGMLPISVRLTPSCQFIRGMEFHLKQNYEDAFKCWEAVANGDDSTSELRSLAWYWIGYENNNLGQYENAETAFTQALVHATGHRNLELRRIRIETKFFHKDAYSAESVLGELKDLEELAREAQSGQEARSNLNKILTTHGNVLFESARRLRDAGQERQAVERYGEAAAKFESVSSEDKWAQFGLATSLHAIGKRTEFVFELFEGPIRRAARDEFFRRVEPRTKVLARSTELICCLSVERLRDQVPSILGDITQSLGEVDGRLTVFSQIQKRNVFKDEFRLDVNELLAKANLRSLQL